MINNISPENSQNWKDWKAAWHYADHLVGVSRLIADMKEALKAHGVDAIHISRPGPDALRVWTADGQYLRWPAPATEPTRPEAVPA